MVQSEAILQNVDSRL